MGRARNGPRPETKTGIQTPPRLASRSGNPKPSPPFPSDGYWFLESFSHGFFSLPLLFLRSRSFAREGDGRRLSLWFISEDAEKSAPVLGEPMDLMTALQLVMKKSLAHDGLVRGLHEAAKAIEKHAAQLCVLAEDCNQADYVKLVKALCADHNVHLVTVPSAKTLGEWAGLCKIDSEGKARKVVGCSCVVVKDYGEESEGLHIVQEYVKSH
ncbi:hypothetical protein C4D60_Mb11t23180 [Musa balbisiana]|uniref:40S ribosomal protein S12 n=1 Tax=Musa balbisiana TaxID=52838 RepID=A0A4S8J7U6_MUSBA|nr:hypothetical protein C4D60_Mb11t23180 [Musa balbisiana]